MVVSYDTTRRDVLYKLSRQTDKRKKHHDRILVAGDIINYELQVLRIHALSCSFIYLRSIAPNVTKSLQ